jgi:hypothetical protein
MEIEVHRCAGNGSLQNIVNKTSQIIRIAKQEIQSLFSYRSWQNQRHYQINLGAFENH